MEKNLDQLIAEAKYFDECLIYAQKRGWANYIDWTDEELWLDYMHKSKLKPEEAVDDHYGEQL